MQTISTNQSNIKMKKNIKYWGSLQGFKTIFLEEEPSHYMINIEGVLISYYNGWTKVQPSEKSDGYYSFCLRIGKKKFNKSQHRLIAEYFLDNPSNYPFINHINGNKKDNSIDNLEWCTSSMNNLHAHATGLSDVFKRTKGAIPKKVGRFLEGVIVKEYDALSYVKRDGYAISSVFRSIKNNYCYIGFIWKYI
jgi:hypothetical protein